MRSTLTGLALVALLALAACGGGEAGSPGTSTGASSRNLPACARPAAEAVAPPDLPVGFPLPPGTLVTSVERPHPGQLVVRGAIPADIQEATAFFSDTLPESGYRVGVGDAEGAESEAPFTGNGYRGKWRVNELPDCPALKLTLVLIEQS